MAFLESTPGVVAVLVAFILFLILALVARWFKKAGPGQALIRSGLGGNKVSFSGIWLIPVLHRLDVMDITQQTLPIELRGMRGAFTRDAVKMDVKAYFTLGVNPTESDVQDVAMNVGAKRASDPETIRNLFQASFEEALKLILAQVEFLDVKENIDKIKMMILQEIGSDLNGYSLINLAIESIQHTPLDQLDPNNILDAQSIARIKELNKGNV